MKAFLPKSKGAVECDRVGVVRKDIERICRDGVQPGRFAHQRDTQRATQAEAAMLRRNHDAGQVTVGLLAKTHLTEADQAQLRRLKGEGGGIGIVDVRPQRFRRGRPAHRAPGPAPQRLVRRRPGERGRDIGQVGGTEGGR